MYNRVYIEKINKLIRKLIKTIFAYLRSFEMEREKLFWALIKAQSAHAEASRKVFNNLGLTEGQPKILYLLRRSDGYVQKELAEFCGVRQSTLTILLDKLEEMNFIRKEKTYVSGRKRAYKIYLTEEGKEKAEELEIEVEKLEEQGFRGFSEEDKDMILKLLAQVENNMKE